MDALCTYVKETKDPLNGFLNEVFKFNDGTPMFAFMQVYGVFVNKMAEHLKTHTESEALDLTLAHVANHPTVQNMVASMMKKQLDRGLNLE